MCGPPTFLSAFPNSRQVRCTHRRQRSEGMSKRDTVRSADIPVGPSEQPTGAMHPSPSAVQSRYLPTSLSKFGAARHRGGNGLAMVQLRAPRERLQLGERSSRSLRPQGTRPAERTLIVAASAGGADGGAEQPLAALAPISALPTLAPISTLPALAPISALPGCHGPSSMVCGPSSTPRKRGVCGPPLSLTFAVSDAYLGRYSAAQAMSSSCSLGRPGLPVSGSQPIMP